MKEKDAIKDMCLPPFDRANQIRYLMQNAQIGDNNIYIKLIKDLYRLPKYIAKYLKTKYLKK